MTKWALYHKCKEDQNLKKKGKKYLITNEKKKHINSTDTDL